MKKDDRRVFPVVFFFVNFQKNRKSAIDLSMKKAYNKY